MKKVLFGFAALLLTLMIAGCPTPTGGDGSGSVQAASDPVVAPGAGDLRLSEYVEITTATEAATIYYTVDGSEPTAASTVYTDRFQAPAEGPLTVKAIAMKDGLEDSSVTSVDYTVADVNIAVGADVKASSTMGVAADGTITQSDFAWAGWGTGALNNGSPVFTGDATHGTFDVWGNARPINAFSTDTDVSTAETVQWAEYDFGSTLAFRKAVLWPRNNDLVGVNFPQDYELQYSDNGTDWTTAKAVTAPEADYNPGAGAVSHEFDSTVEAQYFRLYVTKMVDNETEDSFRTQLMELEVY